MNALSQNVDPVKQAQLQALIQERAQLEQSIKSDDTRINQISTRREQQEYSPLTSRGLPGLGEVYNPKERFDRVAYEDTEEDTPYLGNVTSYAELEADMSANPFKQIPQNYGDIADLRMDSPEALIPGALMTYGAIAGMGPQGSSIRSQSNYARNKLTEFERIKGDKKGFKKNSPMSKFLKENGITDEMIDGSQGANRAEKVRNAVQNKFRKSLGMKTLNSLNPLKNMDEVEPLEEGGKKSKKQKKAEAEARIKADKRSGRIANIKSIGTGTALLPAMYGIGESVKNFVSGKSLEGERANQKEAYNEARALEIKQYLAAIDKYLSTAKNEAGILKAQEDRARVEKLLKDFE